MKRPIAPARTFHISFDTKEMPGKVIAMSATLAEDIFDIIEETKLQAFQQREFRINLATHPLYAKLCAYVKANPPRQA